MELETLKAKLIATNTLSTELTTTAVSADRVADSMREGAVAGTELAAGMSLSEDEASQLARQLGAANTELAQGSAQSAVYAEGMSEVAQEQAEASAAAALLEQRLESVGDEATQSGLKARLFGESLDDIETTDLRANLGPLSGTIASVGATAAAATPAILGMGSALGGLAAGGVLAGAGGAALFAGGIQHRAEALAASTERFENASEASEAIWSNLMEQIDQATAPLQTERTAAFATENLEALVTLSGMAAEGLADVQDTLLPLLSGLRAATLEEAPEIFDALGDSVERLAPLLEGTESVIEATPGAIRYFTDAAVRLGPELATLAWSATVLAAELGELGLTIGEVTLPPLSTLFGVAAWGLDLFNALPGPIKQAGVAAAIAAGGVTLLAGSVGTLAAALWATGIPEIAIAVGLLVGVLAGLEAQFGVVTKAVQFSVGWFNAWLDAVELAVNSVLWFADAVTGLLGPFTMLIPVLGPTLWLLGNLDRVVRAAGAGVDWLGEKIKQLATWADKYLGPVLDMLDKASEKAADQQGFSLEGAKIGEDGGGSAGRADSSDDGPPPPAAPAATTGSGTDNSVNIDTLVVQDQSGDAEKTADRVIKKLEKQRRRQGGHPSG